MILTFLAVAAYSEDLFWAATRGNTDRIGVLLKSGEDINREDLYGRTALMHAAVKGHTETVRVLLEEGAQVNVADVGVNDVLLVIK